MGDLCTIFNKITGCDVPRAEISSKDPKARYSKIEISLGASCEDKELYLSGSFIGVSYLSGGGSCEIKLDYIAAQKIDLRQVRQIRANFSKIYFTCDGHGGLCRIYVCQAMETTIDPSNQSPYSGTVWSASKNSTNIVRRITDYGHVKVNRIKIRNTHATYGVDLGFVSKASIPDTAYFRSYGYRLIAQDDIEFTELDLYGMGFVSTVDDSPVTLKMVATQRL
jgi:hypothetical protein